MKKIKSCLDEKKKKCLHTQQVHPNMHGWTPNQCSFPFRMALFLPFPFILPALFENVDMQTECPVQLEKSSN